MRLKLLVLLCIMSSIGCSSRSQRDASTKLSGPQASASTTQDPVGFFTELLRRHLEHSTVHSSSDACRILGDLMESSTSVLLQTHDALTFILHAQNADATAVQSCMEPRLPLLTGSEAPIGMISALLVAVSKNMAYTISFRRQTVEAAAQSSRAAVRTAALLVAGHSPSLFLDSTSILSEARRRVDGLGTEAPTIDGAALVLTGFLQALSSAYTVVGPEHPEARDLLVAAASVPDLQAHGIHGPAAPVGGAQ